MEDQIKELIAKGIKLDYREIYEDTAVILRWGDDVDYIECKITATKDELSLHPITPEEVLKIRNSMEIIIEECMKDLKSIHQKQVDDNFRAFNEILPTILEVKHNQYALMKDCKIIEFFSTAFDAEKAGLLLYPDHMFSVQKVTDEVINLGAFSL